MKLEIGLFGIENIESILENFNGASRFKCSNMLKGYFFQIGTREEDMLDCVLEKYPDNYHFRISPRTSFLEKDIVDIKYFIAYPKISIKQDYESFLKTDEYIESMKNEDVFILDKLWFKSAKFKEDKIQSLEWAFEFLTGKHFFEKIFKNVKGVEKKSVFRLKNGEEINDLVLIYVNQKLKIIQDKSWMSIEGKLNSGTLAPADLITIDYNDVDTSYSIFRTKECFIKKNYGTLMVVDRDLKDILLEHGANLNFKPVFNVESDIHINYNYLWERVFDIFKKYKGRKKLYFRQ